MKLFCYNMLKSFGRLRAEEGLLRFKVDADASGAGKRSIHHPTPEGRAAFRFMEKEEFIR